MRYPLPRKHQAMAEQLTDAQLIEAYAEYLQINLGRRPRTLEAYRMALARLVECLDGAPMLEADTVTLETFSGIWLHKRGVVARSRKPYVSAIKGFYAWAQGRGLVRTDPAAALRHPKLAKPLPEALTLDNAERLMWAPDMGTFLGLRDAAMLGLLIGCGLRVSGLVALNAEDLRNQEIGGKVRMVVRVTEKGERERLLPIPREAEMLLRVYLDHEELKAFDRAVSVRGSTEHVLFVNGRNTRVAADEYRGEAVRLSRQAVWRMIQRHGEAAGVPEKQRHPHALRHLFGVELAEDEVDLITRQGLLGHADPKSTAIYDAMTIRRKAKSLDGSGPLGKVRSPVSELLKRV